ncbi:recombinase family protein [Marisediminicola sp. LYQ85]|uniref:recombinase family protein n=1 Tax=Marisediminicola sp. LYQ85 TaxID=3391062 RepID=UPI003983D8E5
MSTRAVIYARVSAAEANGQVSDSVQNQIDNLTDLAKRREFDLIGKPFVDDGKSGFKGTGRPGFTRLLLATKRGDHDVILVRHVDRLSRNDGDSSLIRIASQLGGVRWMTADGAETDPSTAGGALTAKMLSAMAEFESAMKSERLLEHYSYAAVSGKLRPSSQTYGFQAGGQHVEDEAEVIRDLYAQVLAGKSLWAILKDLNDRGVPQRRKGGRWEYATLNSILRRPANAGLVSYKGEFLEGVQASWDPIVDPADWYEVQAILTAPGRKTSPGPKPRHLSSSSATCGVCGATMRSNTATDNRRGTRYSILRCPNSSAEERHASGKISDLDPLVRSEIIKAFLIGPSSMFPDKPDDTRALRDALNAILTQQEELTDLMLEGLIKKPQGRARLAGLNAREAELREQIEEAGVSGSSLVDIRRGIYVGKNADLEGFKKLGEAFDALPIEERRKLVRPLLDIRVYPGRFSPSKYLITHKVVTQLNEPDEIVG